MTPWSAIREEYSGWLRTFPLLVAVGMPGNAPEIMVQTDAPVYLNSSFWSDRTHEVESIALREISDEEIDRIFNEVASAIDDDLRRFDPLISYFARFFPDGDPGRIEDERNVAHCVKRDLAWAAI